MHYMWLLKGDCMWDESGVGTLCFVGAVSVDDG
jgi:hypothetical protein